MGWFALNMMLFWGTMAGLPTEPLRWTAIVLSWLGMATGILATGVALTALVWKQERGVAVWLCLVPGLFAVVFLLGEVLVPH